MSGLVDLHQLAARESEQVEWKANVADIDDVVETLSAFANDLANLGGGYVVCGAGETKNEHGFPFMKLMGLTAGRLKEVEKTVLARCRERVSPPLAPLVEELPAETPDRRILVFIMAATDQAHLFRRGVQGAKYFVRIARETREARDGTLRELLIRKGALEPWDRQPCTSATVSDLDLLVLRDALQRMGIFSPDLGVEPFLSEANPLSPFVPPLCVRESLSGVLRPRNFAMLLFGRSVQRFVPGGFSLFSIYPGADRSEPHAERHELAGNLIEQASRLTSLLDQQAVTAFDKNDSVHPNALKYPARALREVMINALAHRDYALVDPTRITVFVDRIEMISPGSLPTGVDPIAFRAGRVAPKWRNQALAWFLSRLQFAQAEGQGIPTVLRTMQEEGCPPPIFETNEARVTCALSAHPRHTTALAQLERAQRKIRLLEIINCGEPEGTPFETLSRALPTASRDSLRVLLRELRKAGLIHIRGATKAARWFPGSEHA